jgi:membrane fusion protein (multidrug efflux system)
MQSVLLSLSRVGITAIVTGFLVACGPAPSGPPEMTGTAKVSVVKLQTTPLTLTSELPGRVRAVVAAQVRPQVTGILQQRLFEEGAIVKKGQLLYKIDPTSYLAEVNRAEATLDHATAAFELAKLKAERNHQLRKIKAVSQQVVDDSDATLKEAQADIASARAELQAQRINLKYTDIKAPVSGRISRSTATIGSLVTANQQLELATIQQLDPIYIDVTQPSLALLELKQSLPENSLHQGSANVDILLQGDMKYPEKGKIQFSEVSVDQNTDTVTLRIQAPNSDSDLLPGMYVRARLEMGRIDKAILLPQQALIRDTNGQSFVWIINDDDAVEQRSVKVSKAIGNQWLVNEGLAATERVMVAGFQKAKVGAKVDVISVEMGATSESITEKRGS